MPRERGTLRLMNVEEHRARACELREMARAEPSFEHARVLNEAAGVHDEHVRTLEEEERNERG